MKLSVKNIEVYYNKMHALKGVSLEVPEGDFVTLIGANGAGKSTTFKAISGFVKPSIGEIYYGGIRIDKLSADKILKLGIAQVPEGRRVFMELTVKENLYLGAYIYNDKVEIERTLSKVFEYFPTLLERKDQLASTMSGGEQQMLSIGRALMSRPKTLLLDEPSLGLAPIIIEEIAKILVDLNETQGVSVVLVEQNAELALEISNTAYVLESGRVALSDSSANLMNNEHVKNAYLGM
jgi:branched-chain amino acid transport system ATP-binding protein